MTARLLTITFSHYCEKARWALDRCGVPYVEEGHLPIFSWIATKRAGAKRTVPALVTGDGGVLTDSSDIAAWADARRPGALLPIDPKERSEALALEEELDRDLGPATRRWGYSHLLSVPASAEYLVKRAPRWEAIGFRVARPLAFGLIKRGLKVDPAGVARSFAKIDAVFAKVGDRLADGRRFLVGDAFSIADLTFATLAAPALFPPELDLPLPPREAIASVIAETDRWRATPAGEHALRLFREHRREVA